MHSKDIAIPRMASELDMGTFGIVQSGGPEPTGWVTKVGDQELWVLWKYGEPDGWREPGPGLDPASLEYHYMGDLGIAIIEQMCDWVVVNHNKLPHELTAYVHTVAGPFTPCPPGTPGGDAVSSGG